MVRRLVVYGVPTDTDCRKRGEQFCEYLPVDFAPANLNPGLKLISASIKVPVPILRLIMKTSDAMSGAAAVLAFNARAAFLSLFSSHPYPNVQVN